METGEEAGEGERGVGEVAGILWRHAGGGGRGAGTVVFAGGLLGEVMALWRLEGAWTLH